MKTAPSAAIMQNCDVRRYRIAAKPRKWSVLAAHDSKTGGMHMKLVSTTLLAVGLMALSACGGGGAENVAANNVVEDYNLTEDLGNESLLGNEVDANVVDANAVDANAADAN